jgi:hypothetical protein
MRPRASVASASILARRLSWLGSCWLDIIAPHGPAQSSWFGQSLGSGGTQPVTGLFALANDLRPKSGKRARGSAARAKPPGGGEGVSATDSDGAPSPLPLFAAHCMRSQGRRRKLASLLALPAPSQAEGRGFEPRFPLHDPTPPLIRTWGVLVFSRTLSRRYGEMDCLARFQSLRERTHGSSARGPVPPS